MPKSHSPDAALKWRLSNADASSPRNLPPLTAVRAFEAAARHQSFTRAAAELGMTQAAVSYQIRLLEDRVGAPLFTRQARQVTLTALGQRFAEPTTRALRMLAQAFMEAREQNRAVLSISTLQTLGIVWLAPRLSSFHIANPQFEVRVETSERLVDFSTEEFDLAVRYGDGRWPGLAARKLFSGRYAPLCSPALRDELQLREPRDLLKARLLGAIDPWWKRWFAAAGEPGVSLDGRPTLTLHMQAMDIQAALRGHGVAMAMPELFADEIAAGRLVLPFDRVVNDTVNGYWAVHPVGREREPKIKLFCDWVAAEAEATLRASIVRDDYLAPRRAKAAE